MKGIIPIWDTENYELMKTMGVGKERNLNVQLSVAWSPDGRMLASSSYDLCIWDVNSGTLEKTVGGHGLYDAAWSPIVRSGLVAAASSKGTVLISDLKQGKARLQLEGHVGDVTRVAFSSDGTILASAGPDLRLWDCETWKPLAVISSLTSTGSFLAFHPSRHLLATSQRGYRRVKGDADPGVRIWELEWNVLRGQVASAKTPDAVQHTTAKIVLVGDSGVGKTGIGWRLAHGEFKEHSSTHGQQFWVLNALNTRRADGTQCEAILWDLAGQPDYRLIHALFLDDADLALLLFDPTDGRDPLHGVDFWLSQLNPDLLFGTPGSQLQKTDEPHLCPTILIGARTDRGDARLTAAELDSFCNLRGVAGGYVASSAKEGSGLAELIRRMKELVSWDQKTTTVTTLTFKRIKDYVLSLKENPRRTRVIVNPNELRKQLEKTDARWRFSDAEMMTAVGHLGNYGYVRVLRTSKGESRILLAPELLNNLAASLVLEARRNPKGLGSLEEGRLLGREYPLHELEKLSKGEQEILLDSAALLFLKHNVCFRETDPLRGLSYLVFPELINLKKPIVPDEQRLEDDTSYTVSGAVQNVYASLVVLLGYTQTFTRTDQWRSQARYEVGDGLICGFRQESDHDAELDLVLYFGKNVGEPVRLLFKGLFESFLARRNLKVFRYEPVRCPNGHGLNRGVLQDQSRSGKDFAYCPTCGERVVLPRTDEQIHLTQAERGEVDEQQWFATHRSRFEQAAFQLASYAQSRQRSRSSCFISYAWGDKNQERWVERSLATDLRKAGIDVILDRWENARVGASVARFVERIEKCVRVVVVGTPLYREKYENKEANKGYVVAAEVDMISNRLLGTETQKESVLPLLLAGEKETSLPPLLHSRVFADFRNERDYFVSTFDLILSLYGIPSDDRFASDLRDSLQESQLL